MMAMGTPLRLTALVIALALAAPGQAQIAAIGPANPIVVRADTAAELVSNIRGAYGLAPVGIDRRLMDVAQRQADAMALADRMSHDVAGSFSTRIPRGYSVAAENIAAGSWSLEETMRLWQESPGHLQNMLISEITGIGIGYSYSPRSQRYYFALVLASPR
jgi:uncharacterized protein YkwD